MRDAVTDAESSFGHRATSSGLAVAGGTIGYRRSGNQDGPVIILLHAIGFDSRIWSGVAEELEQNHSIVTRGFRGHGTSSIWTTFGLTDLGRDVLLLLEHLEIEQACIAGCSLGAGGAMWLLPRIRINGPQGFWRIARRSSRPPEISDMVLGRPGAGDMAGRARDFLGLWCSNAFKARGPEYAAAVDFMASCSGSGSQAVLRHCSNRQAREFTAILSRRYRLFGRRRGGDGASDPERHDSPAPGNRTPCSH